MRALALPAVAIALASVGPVAAQDQHGFNPPGIEGEVGIGVAVVPRYEGASDFVVNPWPLVRIERLTLGNGFQIGGSGGNGGFSLGPSLKMRGARKAADTPALAGLTDIDRAFEFGLKASYETVGTRMHASIRRGFGGHHGWVGEAGFDFLARPAADLTLYAGPRVTYADNEYMDTYFSVPAGGAGGFSGFDADGGFKSLGVEVGARRDFGAAWALEGVATYDRLIGDAGASPITAVGTRDQFGVRAGVVRKFRIDF